MFCSRLLCTDWAKIKICLLNSLQVNHLLESELKCEAPELQNDQPSLICDEMTFSRKTYRGRYVFNRLPFGVQVAPRSFFIFT